MSTHHHQSVMFDESIKGLNIEKNGIYVDATFGRGGHTTGILTKLSQSGRVIAFDRDKSAIDFAKSKFSDNRLELLHCTFSNIKEVVETQDLVGKINGILIDLGVSSPQLDNAERGFSFLRDGPLDMRMDQSNGLSAKVWLAQANEEEIAKVLYEYGEEKKSRQIAKAIKLHQKQKAIETTFDLAQIISSVVRKEKNKHPATRSFQAIRIFINQELQELLAVLEHCIHLLSKKGRLAVITFHSIEDRIVKQFIQKNSRPKPLPKGLPVSNDQIEQVVLKDLGKQLPSDDEIKLNPRARSAILRVAEKC